MSKRKSDLVLFIVFLLFFIWIIASWIEVITKNSNSNATYSVFNCFVLLVKFSKFIHG